MVEIRVSQIRARSAFVYGYMAFAAVMLPFAVLFGIIGLTGGRAVFVNGQAVFGPTAIVASLLMGLLFPLIPALALTAGTVILRLLRERAPLLRHKGD